jgi:polyribonucleotide nucleotidyltransferase
MNEDKCFEVEIGGRALVFSTGHLAKQANGAVYARYGDTAVLVTACMEDEPREDVDFFPLIVDYEERFYAAGKIPGGFIKREGKPSESAILSARLVDRSIRSLFPEHMKNDVHVVATILSVDQTNPPDVLAINAASAALAISEIPWDGPVGAVRVGYIDGSLVINPMEEDMQNSTLDLVVAGHKEGITMVEGGAGEVPEEVLVDALELAQQEIRRLVDFQLKMREEVGKPKCEIPAPQEVPEIDECIKTDHYGEIYEAVKIHAKKERSDAIKAIKEKVWEKFKDTYPEQEGYVSNAVTKYVKKAMRSLILDEGLRADGRAMDELRPISCEVSLLPRAHGSAVFTRGETQALVVTTLGMFGEDEQILDGLKLDEPPKRFMLHYNFPPFSVGEVRPMRGPGRREIGHGALAERAVKPLIPDESQFPYIIRVVSDILESNGSSSMASVCGASMSLMDAGVPIAKSVAGIAMGLIKEGDKYAILTDIQGLEDHYGDMDFKVAGTRDGVTALQMDNKAGGITREILVQALDQAKRGRLQILDIMKKAIDRPRDELSQYAPRIYTMNIDPDKIRDVIGPGGKTIRSIVQKTGVKIDIADDGVVHIAASSESAANEAMSIIKSLTKDVEPGEVYIGKVTRLTNFGAFIELLPGKEGLLHISEVSTSHVPKIEDIFKVGDRVLVVVKEIDELGRVNLSRKRIMENPDDYPLDPDMQTFLEEERKRDSSLAPKKRENDKGQTRHPRHKREQ